MQVEVCDGISLTNPIGDGKDYRGGAIVDVSEGRAAAWIARGWVKVITLTPMSKPVSAPEEPFQRRRYR